jgi:hypothetical protein
MIVSTAVITTVTRNRTFCKPQNAPDLSLSMNQKTQITASEAKKIPQFSLSLTS